MGNPFIDDYYDELEVERQASRLLHADARGQEVANLQHGWAMMDESGVKEGDVVYVEWGADSAYSNGNLSHTGRINKIDGGFIYVASSMRSVGNLSLPISFLRVIRINRELSDNPFVQAAR